MISRLAIRGRDENFLFSPPILLSFYSLYIVTITTVTLNNIRLRECAATCYLPLTLLDLTLYCG